MGRFRSPEIRQDPRRAEATTEEETMKSKKLHLLLLLLPLTLALVLNDCVAQSHREFPGRFYDGRMPPGLETCPGTNRRIRGSSFVLVKYADSSIKVTEYTEVGRQRDDGVGAIEFRLIPTGGPSDPSFAAAEVKIIGKEGHDTQGNTVDPSWLNKTGQGHESIVVCPGDKTPVGSYEYEVQVEGVGKVDPRADVID